MTKIIHKRTFSETADQIQDVCFNLLTENPFYGHILSNINRQLVDEPENQKEPTEMRTLGLSTVKMSLNYPLWEPLTTKEKENRMFHELLHFVFLHPWENKPNNLGLFYTACDLSVNQYCNDRTSLR